MITRLYVDNFRCLVNFELKLENFHLLAGLNGSGKSSVLDVVDGLQRLLSGQAKVNDKSVLPYASRTRWSDRDTQVVELHTQVGGEEMRYRLKVQHESGGRRARIIFEYRAVLQKTIPGFQKLRLEKVGSEARTLVAVFGSGKEEYELALDELSDGQRVLLVLYGMLHFLDKSGRLLFLDEPDNFLAAAEIQPWLLCAEDAIGDGLPQVVIVSHHAELIDYLGGDRGILLEREVTGVTKTRPLRDIGIPETMKLSEVITRGWEQ